MPGSNALRAGLERHTPAIHFKRYVHPCTHACTSTKTFLGNNTPWLHRNPSSRSSPLLARGLVRDQSLNAMLGVFGGVASELRSLSQRKPVPACPGDRREIYLLLLTSLRLSACALVPRCSPCLPPFSLPIPPWTSKTAPYSAPEDFHTTL